jgi:flagellum-specific ATP synthase
VKPHLFQSRLRAFDPVKRWGRVERIHATYLEASGPSLPLGAICTIESAIRDRSFEAEVISIDRTSISLAPLEDNVPTFSGARVTAVSNTHAVPVGDALLGRAVDPMGRPIDGKPATEGHKLGSLHGEPLSPLSRQSPRHIFQTGLRAIDGLLTLGKGQRIGLFAPSGAGKTTLMTQIAQQAQADVIILCLVGERGREVENIWNEALSEEARSKSILVAATSDQPAPLRVRACHYALALADHWRAQGKHVLLLLDSVTRLAMAMREVGLAAGEPPTVRAYTPSVFAAVPKLVERCGALRSGGAITAIMTVLSEGEEIDDPVCEMMKSILDGHILLSRNLAEQGHFPAIDIPRSISRQADALIEPKLMQSARKVQSWLSQYEASKTLIDAGLYAAGSNAELDEAIQRRPAIMDFLRQDRRSASSQIETESRLTQLTAKAA